MKALYDEDSANAVYAENKLQQDWERSERNRILNMTNPQRKQQAWNNLYPKLAIEGLSEDELNIPY